MLFGHVRRWKSDARFWARLRKSFDIEDITEEVLGAGNGGGPNQRGARKLIRATKKPSKERLGTASGTQTE